MKNLNLIFLFHGTIFLPLCVNAAVDPTFFFSFQVYGLRPGSYENIHFATNASSSSPIQFRSKSRSEVYTTSLPIRSPFLSFTRSGTGSEEATPPTAQALAIVEIDPSWKQVLIIFSKISAQGQREKYHAIAIQDDQSSFPRSSIRVLNMTGVDILALIGDQKMSLENLSCSPSKPISGDDAAVSIAAKGASRYHLLYRNNLRVGENSRNLLILRPPVRHGSLRIGGHLIRENLNSRAR